MLPPVLVRATNPFNLLPSFLVRPFSYGILVRIHRALFRMYALRVHRFLCKLVLRPLAPDGAGALALG